MSTTTPTITEPAAPLTEPPREGHRAKAVLALARFETRELLQQIPVLFFFALYVVLIALRLMSKDGMDDFPVLNTVDRRTQATPLLFALALFICANSAALRSRKHGTVQQFGVLTMEPWRRTLAHLLSVVPYAGLTALVVAAEYTREALKPGAIGHGSLGELAVGPLSVLLAGVTGVLLARLLPSSFVPILFVIAVYVLGVLVSGLIDVRQEWVGWLDPIQFFSSGGGDPVPSDLLGRPAGWHALYVTGLCAVLACVALLVAGGRTRAVKAATALALAATAAGAIGQFPGDTSALDAARRTASDSPAKVQSCTTHDGSTYCSFPEWAGVRDDWAEVVDRVRSGAGGTAAEGRLTVRQRVYTDGGVEIDGAIDPSTTPGEVTVGTRWGGNRVPEFAVGVATVLVGGSEDVTTEPMCDARAVTIMWLVLGQDPTPTDTFRNVRLDDSTTGSGVVLAPTNGLSLSGPQTTVIRELLDRPRAEMTARVKAHWTELTSARTTTAQAAKLLGVEVPKEADQCEE
ncbi:MULTISPECIES: ABC transporter permease [unclassified Streptomyces]|uniref:ABC transporter permease n=1 Tax=unclassified Streptomyces TaxID=2593676 RepID=UPI00037F6750|nr:ABC transporter permease [Streptomyces sp. 303MFCol5.2]